MGMDHVIDEECNWCDINELNEHGWNGCGGWWLEMVDMHGNEWNGWGWFRINMINMLMEMS